MRVPAKDKKIQDNRNSRVKFNYTYKNMKNWNSCSFEESKRGHVFITFDSTKETSHVLSLVFAFINFFKSCSLTRAIKTKHLMI